MRSMSFEIIADWSKNSGGVIDGGTGLIALAGFPSPMTGIITLSSSDSNAWTPSRSNRSRAYSHARRNFFR